MPLKRKERKQARKPHKARTWIHEKNRFGTLPFDRLVAPTPGIFDDPVRCYRINEEWAPIIMGIVSLLTEIRMWKGAIDEGFPAIREIERFLDGEICGVFGCPDVEDCLELSGIIASLVATSFATQQAGNTQGHFDELNAAYDGTAQSIGANIPTTAPNLDPFHDNALCYVMERIIAVYANAKGAGLVTLTDLQVWYQDMIQATRDIVPIVPDYLWYLVGDELYGCSNVADALTALGDGTAILDFACCMREELRGVGMSQSNFDAAIATCVASLSGDAGIIACLFSGDNSLDHYLSFLEAYSGTLQRQTDGVDFICQCAPAGWFWVDVPWEWTTTLHGGQENSPLFGHTNPSNGELFAIQFRHRRIAGGAGKAFGGVQPSGEIDSVVNGATGNQASGLRLWEEPFIGVWEGRDAVGWPIAFAQQADYVPAQRQANITWTIKFHDRVDQGHTRQSFFSNMRLLYKETP